MRTAEGLPEVGAVMSGWKKARVYGTALDGRRRVVAEVGVPDSFTKAAALAYVRQITRHDRMTGRTYYPYAVLAEGDLYVHDGPIHNQPCPHCGRF